VTVPLLAIVGEHDMQVPPEDTERIAELAPGPCEARVVNDLSHVLRPDPLRRGPRDYRRELRDPVSPALLESVTRWIDSQIKA